MEKFLNLKYSCFMIKYCVQVPPLLNSIGGENTLSLMVLMKTQKNTRLWTQFFWRTCSAQIYTLCSLAKLVTTTSATQSPHQSRLTCTVGSHVNNHLSAQSSFQLDHSACRCSTERTPCLLAGDTKPCAKWWEPDLHLLSPGGRELSRWETTSPPR